MIRIRRVIDRIYQRVQRVAVGAHEHIVRYELRLERHWAANQVVESDRAIGHPQPKRGLAPEREERIDLLHGKRATVVVIPGLPTS